jgi:hypothetical protein
MSGTVAGISGERLLLPLLRDIIAAGAEGSLKFESLISERPSNSLILVRLLAVLL